MEECPAAAYCVGSMKKCFDYTCFVALRANTEIVHAVSFNCWYFLCMPMWRGVHCALLVKCQGMQAGCCFLVHA